MQAMMRALLFAFCVVVVLGAKRRGPMDLDEMDGDMKQSHMRAFETADTSGDGKLDKEEYKAFHRRALERMDTSSPGIAKAIESSDRMRGDMFDRLDKDKDGMLTGAEWNSIYDREKLPRGMPGMEDEDFEDMHDLRSRMPKGAMGHMPHLLETDDDKAKAFAEADANKDGSVSADELQAYMFKPHEEAEKERKERMDTREAKRKDRSKRNPKEKGDFEGLEGQAGAERSERMKEFDKRFEERKKEVEERMSQAKERLSGVRVKQAERMFKRYDANADGKITNEEWGNFAKASGERMRRADQFRREALDKAASEVNPSV